MRSKDPNQVEKILAAAIQLFGTQQFHAVRMEDVAIAAGVGKGTLYRYFQDKGDLYYELIARAAKEVQERLLVAVSQATSARDKLIRLVAAGIEYSDAKPYVVPLVQQVECLHGTTTPWQPAREAFVRMVVEIFQGAAASGEFQVTYPEQSAMMLIGGIRHLALFVKPSRMPGIAQAIVRDFLDGVARPKAASAR